jgi:signal transduction histidine kinase
VNVLLVDDQPAKLLSYEVILAELGESLIKASSAREALSQLLKHDVAVVLIDVQMPELDGFELAAMIREHPRFQQTALIFVSATHLSELDRLKGYEAGGVDYVPVPVIPELLRAKVRVFADLHRKTRQLESLNGELEQRVAERTTALEASHAALRTLNEDLEARIEERTREREQALGQLFEAQKIDTIGQLTGGVAHDFNNLLMAMLGSMQILKKRLSDDPTSQRLLENAVKAAERGAALTQRLLAFARRQELKPESVSIPNLVGGMKDLLDKALGPGVELVQELGSGLPSVQIDPNQLELALLNLCVNARDAMDGVGTILLRADECHRDHPDAPERLGHGAFVRLSIIDHGMGMEEAVLARATEPFFTTKGVGKGTGLGLSMVHGLAVQSGGALKVSSVIGRGSRIELWLPIAEPDAAIVSAPAEAPALSIGPEQSYNVLVVDDDSLVAAGTAAMLEDLGHSVLEASSGLEALAVLERETSVELVITDHAMPGMTGMELAQRLKERWPGLPVILASGYADIPQNGDGLRNLPRLSKPFLQGQLAEAIALNVAPERKTQSEAAAQA